MYRLILANGFTSPKDQTLTRVCLKFWSRDACYGGIESLFSFFLTCCILWRESSRDLLTRGNFHSKLPDPERLGMHEEWPARRRRRHRAGGKERYVDVSPLCFFYPLRPLSLSPSLALRSGRGGGGAGGQPGRPRLTSRPEYSLLRPAAGFMAGAQDPLIVLNRPHTAVLSRVCCRLINVLITPAIGYREVIITLAGLAGRGSTGTPTARIGRRGRAQGAICECHWRLKYVSHRRPNRVRLRIWPRRRRSVTGQQPGRSVAGKGVREASAGGHASQQTQCKQAGGQTYWRGRQRNGHPLTEVRRDR